MNLTCFTSLSWAYQLHYYLCFRTLRKRQLFAGNHATPIEQFIEICARHDYHLLDYQAYSDQLRCLVSLKPSQSVSKVLQTIKSNSSRELSLQLDLPKPVWARGYFARSTGRVNIHSVKSYLESQAEHHGYAGRLLPPVYRYRTSQPVELRSPHAIFDLSHHVVLATCNRKGVFDSKLGGELANYWLRVAEVRGFAIDQLSIVPDHVHLIVRIVPKMSIEECTLLLMNNGQHFVGKNFPEILVNVGIAQLWQPSAYAGTCGKVTTALLKKWLDASE
jgi:putative transposase